MTIKKEICIDNGKVLTLHEKEEELTKNQKMILNNIETGANVVFDCYRQCGFTTLILNLLAYWFKHKNGDFCLVVDRINSFEEKKRMLKKIFSFYGLEYTDCNENDSEKLKKYGLYKMTALNGGSSVTIVTASTFNSSNIFRYKKIIIDDAAFIENDVLLKLYKLNLPDCQVIVGSCHAGTCNTSQKKELSETYFSHIIKDIEEKKEPPYTWFHVYVRWWKDKKYSDIIEGQTNALFLTPEMEGYLFNGKRKFDVKSVIDLKKILGIENFNIEINCNARCYDE